MSITLEDEGVDAGAKITVAVEDTDIVEENDGSGAIEEVATEAGGLSEVVNELSILPGGGDIVGIVEIVRSVLLVVARAPG